MGYNRAMESQQPHGNHRRRNPQHPQQETRSSRHRSERTARVSGKPADSDQQSRKRYRTIGRWRHTSVVICTTIMAIGCIIGLLLFARPTISTVENRTLQAYPEFSSESFLDGSYFTDVALWYADTYPLREGMVSSALRFKSLFGFSPRQGLVGGNVHADEIPVPNASAPEKQPDTPTDEQSNASPSEPQADAQSNASPSEPQADSNSAKPTEQTEAPDERAIAEAVQNSIMNGLYIKDGAAYSIYYFSQSGADTYVAAVNEAAERLDGISHVYSLLVPSSAVVLPEDEYIGVGGSDQRQVLDYVWSRLSEAATQVDILDTMQQHGDEYVYFRTDHHWTQLGAYYGYVEFCKARGIKPVALETYSYRDDGEFTGTYYWSIAEIMDPWPDDFETYTPADTNTIEWWGGYEDSEHGTLDIVEDASDWDPTEKYDAFAACDPARGLVHNQKIKDGSSCLVVKDSYGSAFIPFLVANYEYVHILDPRYYLGSVTAYARDNEVQDVIFVFGINVGLADTYAGVLYDSIVRE